LTSPADPLRNERAARRALLASQTDAPIECDDCVEDNPLALSITTEGALRCDECQRVRTCTEPYDGHHVARRINDQAFVVPIGSNDHRVLSALWRKWPKAQRDSRGKGPLYGVIAARRGMMDVTQLFLEHEEREIAALVELDAALSATLGDEWWRHLKSPEKDNG